MEVLHHVWDLGQATVAEIQARILRDRKVAYTTVMTVMKKLADKGYLQFTKDGATYIYSAARSPEDVQHSLIDDLVEKVFKGSTLALVQTLVRHEDLTVSERREIKDLIDDMEDDDDHAG